MGKWSDAAAKRGDYTRARSFIALALTIGREIGEDAFLLEVSASVLTRTGRYCQAAEILGTADQVNASVGKERSASDQARYDGTIERCAQGLDPARLAVGLEAGARLDWAAAVEKALSTLAEQ